MTDVFISYARKDTAFVRRLHEAFVAAHREPWIDWRDIPPATDWLGEIFSAIDATQAVVLVISPDSAASAVCKAEIEHAVLQNKRLIPIVYRDVDPRDLSEAVVKRNWIFFRERDDIDAA